MTLTSQAVPRTDTRTIDVRMEPAYAQAKFAVNTALLETASPAWVMPCPCALKRRAAPAYSLTSCVGSTSCGTARRSTSAAVRRMAST